MAEIPEFQELTDAQADDLYGADPRMCFHCRHYDGGLCKHMPQYVKRLATDRCAQWQETHARALRRGKAETARIVNQSKWLSDIWRPSKEVKR